MIRCTIATEIRPAMVEKKVASIIGRKISAGLAAPSCALYTIMDIGIMVSPEVLSTRNIIWASEALSF